MKIVVLDGYTLNPGDLSWDRLEALGDCTVYDRSAPGEVIERAKDAEVVLVNKVVLNAENMAALPKLQYIGVLATGYNVVDVAFAKSKGIPVTNIPIYGTRSVAQMVFAHVLALAHHVADHSRSVHEGRWSRSIDFCYWDTPLIELDGLTMGIVGFGRIGRATAEIARAFGMNILAHDAFPQSDVPDDVKMADLDTLLKSSDVVSLHCPLTEDNKGIINAERLATMKPTALLINTSRGPLIVEKDLADALNNGVIAGAGLDVLDKEPPSEDSPLLKAKNCHITPHIAWATKAARSRLMNTAVENVRAFLSGTPENVVNP